MYSLLIQTYYLDITLVIEMLLLHNYIFIPIILPPITLLLPNCIVKCYQYFYRINKYTLVEQNFRYADTTFQMAVIL